VPVVKHSIGEMKLNCFIFLKCEVKNWSNW